MARISFAVVLPDVYIAARMVSLSKGGVILTREELVEQLNPVNKRMCWIFDHTNVKGKAKAVAVYTVVWQEDEVESTVIDHGIDEGTETKTEAERVLLLKFNEDTYEVYSSAAFVPGEGCYVWVETSNKRRLTCILSARSRAFQYYIFLINIY
jgi:hypothetical protein